MKSVSAASGIPFGLAAATLLALTCETDEGMVTLVFEEDLGDL